MYPGLTELQQLLMSCRNKLKKKIISILKTLHYAEEQEQGWKKLSIDESYTKLKFSKAHQQKWQI